MILEALLTIKQLSQKLNCSEDKIRSMISRDQIPHVRLGPGKRAPVRFDPREINRWLQSHTRQPRQHRWR